MVQLGQAREDPEQIAPRCSPRAAGV